MLCGGLLGRVAGVVGSPVGVPGVVDVPGVALGEADGVLDGVVGSWLGPGSTDGDGPEGEGDAGGSPAHPASVATSVAARTSITERRAFDITIR